jgi:hypothetical protein
MGGKSDSVDEDLSGVRRGESGGTGNSGMGRRELIERIRSHLHSFMHFGDFMTSLLRHRSSERWSAPH